MSDLDSLKVPFKNMKCVSFANGIILPVVQLPSCIKSPLLCQEKGFMHSSPFFWKEDKNKNNLNHILTLWFPGMAIAVVK